MTGVGELKEVVIEAAELIKKLRSADAGMRVLDVRTEQEFAGGHIAGATHLPSEALLDGPGGEERDQDFIRSVAGDGVKTLIVHCMYSQCRGPAVVQRLAVAAADAKVPVEIALLCGGFHKFVNTVHDEEGGTGDVPGLLEGFQPKFWRRTKSHGLVESDAVDGLEQLGVVTDGVDPVASGTS